MVNFLQTYQEQMLVEQGYDAFSTEEKNKLIALLADREQLTYADITKEYVLNHHKQLKIDILSETCEEEIIKGFTASNGHTYRTNRDDQINLIGQQYELTADESMDVVYWKTEDAGYLAHKREEWLKVYSEAFAYKRNQLFKYNTLKGKIKLAETHAEIVEINWADEVKVEDGSTPAPVTPVEKPVEKDPIEVPEVEIPVEETVDTPEIPEVEVPVEETPEVPVTEEEQVNTESDLIKE